MKRCPTCNQTYNDDALSFCLNDGAPLLSISDAPAPSSQPFDPNVTIPFTMARDTAPQAPQQQQSYQPNTPPANPYSPMPTPSWSPGPSSMPAPKKSALPWILGGVGLLIVLGIGAVVVIAVIAGMSNSNNRNKVDVNLNNSNRNANNSNRVANTNANISKPPGVLQIRDDFSTSKWWTGTLDVGSAWYTNSEYHMRGQSGGYVVAYAPKGSTYQTENANVRVTTRSISGISPSLGYGLALFGEMSKKNELEDYCLVIRTDSNPSYRVVMHRSGKETVLINWTSAPQIRTGTSTNVLEARAAGTVLTFYINGQYTTSVSATSGYEKGLAGFYTSDLSEVAFDDLEIYK
jgi:hypothetical protein